MKKYKKSIKIRGLLGFSWGPLGASWGRLGASWAQLGTYVPKSGPRDGSQTPSKRPRSDLPDHFASHKGGPPWIVFVISMGLWDCWGPEESAKTVPFGPHRPLCLP